MKKVVSLFAAMALCATCALTAFAADTNVNANNGTGVVPLEGNITANPALISVAMPASINFDVGVTTDGTFDKLISGEGTVTNNSNVPIKLSLTQVQDDTALPVLDKFKMYLELASTKEADLTTKTPLANGPVTNKDFGEIAASGGKVALKVFGAEKSAEEVIVANADNDQKFSVATTLKVEKVAK